MQGPRYGVDGWPYVVGLTAATVLAGAAATATRGRARWALSTVAVAAGVPDGLGLRYILRGKLTHRDRLLDRIAWRGDEVVLDAGAGAGLMGVGAARRVPRGRVHCVDLWVGKDLAGSGPDRLHRNAAAEGVAGRVQIHTGDVRALDLPDASVDVAFSVLCLHNIADTAGRAAAARELVRVLRPGGSIVVGDLAGTRDLARWFAEDGLVIVSHERAPGTFPPQRVLHARNPPEARGRTSGFLERVPQSAVPHAVPLTAARRITGSPDHRSDRQLADGAVAVDSALDAKTLAKETTWPRSTGS